MATEGPGEAGLGGGDPAEPPALFCYGPEELLLGGAGAAGSPGGSRFDRALRAGWEARLRRGGLFRYRLGPLRTRLLPGRLGLVAQLNEQRATERRRPQEVRSVRQSFDPRQFHFGQIRREEILFGLRRRPPGPPGAPLTVAINASPLARDHVLLLPEPARALPQVLTAEALLAGLEAVLLSDRRGFRLGFNSLGAFASVNHLHLHGLHLARELRVESAPAEPLLPEAGLYLLREAPAPAFLFYCRDARQLEPLARRVGRATRHLSRRDVAHNLLATRGAAPEGPPGCAARPGLRVLLWARKSCFGAKDEAAFNVAFCELAGHLPAKSVQEYEGLTEAAALQRIQQCLLPDGQFARLQRELVELLSESPPSPPGPS